MIDSFVITLLDVIADVVLVIYILKINFITQASTWMIFFLPTEMASSTLKFISPIPENSGHRRI